MDCDVNTVWSYNRYGQWRSYGYLNTRAGFIEVILTVVSEGSCNTDIWISSYLDSFRDSKGARMDSWVADEGDLDRGVSGHLLLVELSLARIIRHGNPHGYPRGYPSEWPRNDYTRMGVRTL